MRKIKTIVLVLLVLLLAFQFYFDLQLRKTNGVLVAHINLIETFVQRELPDQVTKFNGETSSLTSTIAPTK